MAAISRSAVAAAWAALVLAVQLSADDWPQFQHDAARSGFSPDSPGPRVSLRWTWNTDQDTAVRIARMAQPVVAGGRVFIGTVDGKLHALSERTGGELWSFSSGGPVMGSAACLDGRVFFGSHDRRVYALDASTGREVWRHETGAGVWAAPCLAGGKVFAGSRDGRLYALDAGTGRLLWRYPEDGPMFLPPVLTPPAFKDGVVYFGRESMYATALRASDGRPLWERRLHGQSFQDTWPVVAGEHVIFRTVPAYGFHRCLHWGCDTVLADAEAGKTWASESPVVRKHLDKDPHMKTFHVLRREDGREAYTTPVLPICMGGGGAPSPPVVDRSGTVHLVFLSKEGQIRGGVSAKHGADLGAMDVRTGKITRHRIAGRFNREINLVADEAGGISMGGTRIYVNHTMHLGAHDTATGTLFGIMSEQDPFPDGAALAAPLAMFRNAGEKLVYSSNQKTRSVWHWAAPYPGVAIANGAVYWMGDGCGVAAVEGK